VVGIAILLSVRIKRKIAKKYERQIGKILSFGKTLKIRCRKKWGFLMGTTISGSGSSRKILLRKVLLICGILASLLYVSTDILAGMLWEGYSFTDQAISELSAIGAPTRPLVVPLITIYVVLVIAFGLGVWGSAGRNRALRVTGGLLMIIGLVGLAWTPFPMHLGEPVSSLANTMHSIFAGIQVLLTLLAMGFGAASYRNWFRFYSIGTILALLVTGVVAFGLAAAGMISLELLATLFTVVTDSNKL
jgi:hypothetical protein